MRSTQGRRSVAAGIAALALGAAAHAQMSNTARAPERSTPRSERAWQLTASAFAAYDSNITLVAEDALQGYAGGLRAGAQANGSWRLLDGDRLEAGIGGLLTQTTTQGEDDADEFDLTTVSPRAWAALKLPFGERTARVQIDYGYRRDWLEGDDFERRHVSRISARVPLSDRIDAAFHYGVDLKEFDASGLHAFNARRDAEHHRTGVELRWLAEDARNEVSFGYEFLRNLAEQNEFDFDGHGVAARARTRLPLRLPLWLDLLASYTDVDYERVALSPRREARIQLYRTALLVPLSPQLVVEMSYAYLRMGADEARFRTKRHLVTSTLSYHF